MSAWHERPVTAGHKDTIMRFRAHVQDLKLRAFERIYRTPRALMERAWSLWTGFLLESQRWKAQHSKGHLDQLETVLSTISDRRLRLLVRDIFNRWRLCKSMKIIKKNTKTRGLDDVSPEPVKKPIPIRERPRSPPVRVVHAVRPLSPPRVYTAAPPVMTIAPPVITTQPPPVTTAPPLMTTAPFCWTSPVIRPPPPILGPPVGSNSPPPPILTPVTHSWDHQLVSHDVYSHEYGPRNSPRSVYSQSAVMSPAAPVSPVPLESRVYMTTASPTILKRSNSVPHTAPTTRSLEVVQPNRSQRIPPRSRSVSSPSSPRPPSPSSSPNGPFQSQRCSCGKFYQYNAEFCHDCGLARPLKASDEFDLMDLNHDGVISREEWNRAMSRAGAVAKPSSPSVASAAARSPSNPSLLQLCNPRTGRSSKETIATFGRPETPEGDLPTVKMSSAAPSTPPRQRKLGLFMSGTKEPPSREEQTSPASSILSLRGLRLRQQR